MKRKSILGDSGILHRVSVTEDECYMTLSYVELFKLIRYFQEEKRRYFELYLKCLEEQIETGQVDLCQHKLEQERNKHWQKHLDCEKLVQWCFEETTRRTQHHGL